MQDILVRSLSTSGGVRILACSVSNLAAQICTMQHTSATASIALGRGLAAGALMGGLLKTGQRVALKFEGSGPMKKMIIEAEYGGSICGMVGNPYAEAEPADGRWNVPGVIGKAGFLTVSKDIGMGGEPYRGTVQLQTSEIGDDVAFYLTDSEQTPSAVGLGANLEESGKIRYCGGFLVQVLPGAEDHQIDTIVSNIKALPAITDMLAGGGGVEAVIHALFGEQAYTILEKQELRFQCSCSIDKVYKALATFTNAELQDMIRQDEGANVTCEFCCNQYTFTSEELTKIITDKTEPPSSDQA